LVDGKGPKNSDRGGGEDRESGLRMKKNDVIASNPAVWGGSRVMPEETGPAGTGGPSSLSSN